MATMATRVIVLPSLLCCCSYPPAAPAAPDLHELIATRAIEPRDVLGPSMAHKLLPSLSATDGPVIPPHYRTIYGQTSCVPASGINAFLATSQPGPVFGQEFTVVFWTSAMPIQHDDRMCWIVVGFEPQEPQSLAALGMPGCWMLVKPDAIFALPSGISDGVLTRNPTSPGRMTFRWTFQEADYGKRIWMQLLVHAPGENAYGFLVSQAIEFTVGHADWRNMLGG